MFTGSLSFREAASWLSPTVTRHQAGACGQTLTGSPATAVCSQGISASTAEGYFGSGHEPIVMAVCSQGLRSPLLGQLFCFLKKIDLVLKEVFTKKTQRQDSVAEVWPAGLSQGTYLRVHWVLGYCVDCT